MFSCKSPAWREQAFTSVTDPLLKDLKDVATGLKQFQERYSLEEKIRRDEGDKAENIKKKRELD